METTEFDRLISMATEEIGESGSAEIRVVIDGDDDIELPEELVAEVQPEQEEPGEEEVHLALLIKDLTVPERVKLAMTGNVVARRLLIRDPSRLVSMFVLHNHGITESELVEYAKNTTLDDNLFRAMSKNSSWMKAYVMKQALVTNPKVPIDVSLHWLKHIKPRELGKIARSKNVPQVVATQARRLVEKRAAR